MHTSQMDLFSFSCSAQYLVDAKQASSSSLPPRRRHRTNFFSFTSQASLSNFLSSGNEITNVNRTCARTLHQRKGKKHANNNHRRHSHDRQGNRQTIRSPHHRTSIHCFFGILRAIGFSLTSTKNITVILIVLDEEISRPKRNPHPLPPRSRGWPPNHVQRLLMIVNG